MIDLDKHMTSCSPEYDVFTFNFTYNQVQEIKKALEQDDLVSEIKKLIEIEEKMVKE